MSHYKPSTSPVLSEMITNPGTLPSWNAHILLDATLATIETINGPATLLGGPCGGCPDTTSIPTGGSLPNGWQYPSDYAIVAPDPNNPSVGNGAWNAFRRALNPPGLSNGKPVFVEIDGVAVGDQVTEDWRTCYDPVNFPGTTCTGATSGAQSGRAYPTNPDDAVANPPAPNAWGDTTFTIWNPAFTTPGNEPCPGIHRMHCEIDGDWSAYATDTADPSWDGLNGHIALRNVAFGTLIDLQGFVFWDPAHTSECFHNFSGWELHPVTAWRLHV